MDFAGGTLTSDGGVLLLRQVSRGLGLTKGLAACFTDYRHPVFVEHTVEQLVEQRVLGLALGYPDLNDHNRLRNDPLLAVACEKTKVGRPDDPQSQRLAGASTLNRLERSNSQSSRAHKLPHDPAKIQNWLLEVGMRCLPKRAKRIVVDLDSMGHHLHGLQEGARFNAYYDGYCYVPLYVVIDEIVVWAQLCTTQNEAAAAVVPALTRIVAALRQRSPQARILVRGDSGFCREEIMAWCEAQTHVAYCLGLAKNAVLLRDLAPWLTHAHLRQLSAQTPAPVREFADLTYRTQSSWSRDRRVIGKAEYTTLGANPRFIVTSLDTSWGPDALTPQSLYEEVYCARGEMENVLKQQVLDLAGDRLSTHFLVGNQLRMWFACFAHLLLARLRSLGCHGTALARATVGTVRLRLLKIAALVTVSVRRIHVALCSHCPDRALFARCHAQLMAAEPAPLG